MASSVRTTDEFRRAGPSQTQVTLTYDWSNVPQYIRDRGIHFPPFGPEHLPNSLHHLAQLAAPTSPASGS